MSDLLFSLLFAVIVATAITIAMLPRRLRHGRGATCICPEHRVLRGLARTLQPPGRGMALGERRWRS